MELFVNTTNSERIIVAVDGDEIIEDAMLEKAQKLLSAIDKILKKKKVKFTDLTSIKVNIGPGSFTGLRVGMSVANALGWALGIPVNKKDVRREGPIEPVYS